MKIIASLVIALMAKISIKAERKLRNFKSRFLYFALIFLRLFLEGYESGILKIVQFKHWDLCYYYSFIPKTEPEIRLPEVECLQKELMSLVLILIVSRSNIRV